jgi:hypothetical protein
MSKLYILANWTSRISNIIMEFLMSNPIRDHAVYISTPQYATSLFIELFTRHWANNDSVKSLRNMLYVMLGH